MPELPEVETICNRLRNQILNKIVKEAFQITKHLNLRYPISKSIEDSFTNAKLLSISRRSKYIIINFDNGLSLIIHLGMSGKVLLEGDNYVYKKHDHFVLKFNDGVQLIYNDARRFGLIDYVQTQHITNYHRFTNLGAEPLSAEFSLAYFHKILLNKKQPIKLTIMDNQNIVGIGNIYASESLFASKISPLRAACSLNDDEVEMLRDKIIEILKEAIKQGGSSIKDYRNSDGEAGYFQHYFKVYGREKKECIVCEDKIIKVKQAGRASFYCPACQN